MTQTTSTTSTTSTKGTKSTSAMRLRFCMALVCGAVGVLAAQRPAPATRFTIAVIPDTQNYIDYTHQKAEGFPFDASDLFFEQMRYVARHAQSQGGDIAFVSAVGDMWQHTSLLMDPAHAARGFKRGDNALLEHFLEPTEKTRAVEIPLVKAGYEIIAGKLPFSVVPGNHDYDAQWTDLQHPAAPERKDDSRYGLLHVGGLTNFQSVFSDRSAFFKDRPWYVASHDGGADSAQVFTAGGYRFLHIGLQFDAPNASLAWAESVIARFPGLPTIVSTHNYLDTSGERLSGSGNDNSAIDPDDNSPPMVWDKFISRHDQIFMVLCGHRNSNGLRVEANRHGHQVYQIMSDFQGRQQVARARGVTAPGGGIGDGWLRLMTFDMAQASPTVRVRTYSTHYRKFSVDLREYAAWYKAGLDSTLSDAAFHARDDFSLTLTDFRRRFGPPVP